TAPDRTGEPASSGTAGRAARPESPAQGTPPAAAGSGGPLAPAAPSGGASSPEVPAPELITEPDDDSAYIFDQSALRTYNLLIAPADLANIDKQPSLETWVPASVEFEGKTYGPLKIRYKGSAGSFKYPCTSDGPNDPKDGKCSIKIGFDEINEEERFFGLKKLNLHAMIQDPSLMHDRLGYSLFREHGVAASRAVHARVLINGKLEGLFIAVEQVDGRFTRARFGDGGEGNLYKEAWVTMDSEADYLESLETNKREQPSVRRMLDFQAAVRSRGAVASFFDRDYMLRYFAVDRVIINDDGVLHFYCDAASPNYPGTSHNFYWYESTAAGRFWLIPWDLDLAFDATPFVHVSPAWFAPASCTCLKDAKYGSQYPASCDPLVQRFIDWRSDFDREVDRFLQGPFAAERVEQKLRQWSEQIRPVVIEAAGVNHAPTEREWTSALDVLRSKIEAARRNRGYQYAQ
ncbi:MAG TPA: CotH kinase family protein, partial [Polyangiales bacterium]|nr:CotH kinase family protein [Polyangiales bacterium]